MLDSRQARIYHEDTKSTKKASEGASCGAMLILADPRNLFLSPSWLGCPPPTATAQMAESIPAMPQTQRRLPAMRIAASRVAPTIFFFVLFVSSW